MVRLWTLVFLVALVPASPAQELLPLQYAVKFVCGQPYDTVNHVVVPGMYLTAINVHNPGVKPVSFLEKVAVALPGEKAGPVTKFTKNKLGPDEALEIDCKDIFERAHSERFLKGFVVLESEEELDVVAVYTAAGATKQIETMAIERVPVRHVKP